MFAVVSIHRVNLRVENRHTFVCQHRHHLLHLILSRQTLSSTHRYVWCPMVSPGISWYHMVSLWSSLASFDLVRVSILSFEFVSSRLVWPHLLAFRLAPSQSVSSGLVSFGLVSFGLVSFGLVSFGLNCSRHLASKLMGFRVVLPSLLAYVERWLKD